MTNQELPCLKLAWLGVCVTSQAEEDVWRETNGGDRTPWHPLFREYKIALETLAAAIKKTYGDNACLHMPYAIQKHEMFYITDGEYGMTPIRNIPPENVLAELSTVEPI
jgi:hypothetical protein